MKLRVICTVAVLFILLPLCAHASSNISLLVVLDQEDNDSVIAAVERTIDIINSNNDTLPEYLLQYTTDNKVEPHTIQILSTNIWSTLTVG